MAQRRPLELSAMGAVRPPADTAVAAAQRRELQGFDAVWWADHFLHWFPLSIWTPELVPQAAAGQASPHVWFDPVPVVAAAAGATRDVRPWLAASHVLVLPSRLREGVPRTILEAMACGRPVVTTDAPDIALEVLVEEHDGWFDLPDPAPALPPVQLPRAPKRHHR